jgi:hypothetical protein
MKKKFLFYKTSCLNKEVNCTKPFPSARIPWQHWKGKFLEKCACSSLIPWLWLILLSNIKECQGSGDLCGQKVVVPAKFYLPTARSTKANGKQPESCLGRVYNFQLGCFCYECIGMAYTNTPTSSVENLAQVLSCYLSLSMPTVTVSKVVQLQA